MKRADKLNEKVDVSKNLLSRVTSYTQHKFKMKAPGWSEGRMAFINNQGQLTSPWLVSSDQFSNSSKALSFLSASTMKIRQKMKAFCCSYHLPIINLRESMEIDTTNQNGVIILANMSGHGPFSNTFESLVLFSKLK